MFQWFYDLVMSYIMPILASIMSFLGMDGKKSVSFEGLPESSEGGANDAPEQPLQ
jgi:hypothetical protein